MTTRWPALALSSPLVSTTRRPGERAVPACLASSVDCSLTREAVPPMWNVRIVSCVPRSPHDRPRTPPAATPGPRRAPARRASGRRGEHAAGRAELDQLAGREVAAVALRAAAAAARAGQHRTDADLL